MKIVHYIPSIDRTSGGVGSYMQLLAKELGKLCELYIVTQSSENPLTIENSKVIFLNNNWKRPFKMKHEWLQVLDSIHPSIVHVNCCWRPESAFTQKWAQANGYKVILTPHGMLEPWIMKRHYWTKKVPALLLYQKSAIKNADCLHATADSEKQNLLKLGYNDKIEVIANGINVSDIKLKEEWSRKKDILFLSRVHVKKGIEFLLEAVADLRNELKGYTIHIAGEGEEDYINSLKNKAKSLNISEYIDFCGGVYGDRKWELYKKADLFALPTYSENFGIVVAEALASGTPVITTNGTPWEELNDTKSGWCINIGTKPLVAALKQFLSLNENELEDMGRNGRKLVESKYSSEYIAKQFIKLYNRL